MLGARGGAEREHLFGRREAREEFHHLRDSTEPGLGGVHLAEATLEDGRHAIGDGIQALHQVDGKLDRQGSHRGNSSTREDREAMPPNVVARASAVGPHPVI